MENIRTKIGYLKVYRLKFSNYNNQNNILFNLIFKTTLITKICSKFVIVTCNEKFRRSHSLASIFIPNVYEFLF